MGRWGVLAALVFLFGCGGSDEPAAIPVNVGVHEASATSCSDASCAPAPRCLPRHCVFLSCGLMSDGCGGEMDCGVCSNGAKCGSAGVPNQCPEQRPAPQNLHRSRD